MEIAGGTTVSEKTLELRKIDVPVVNPAIGTTVPPPGRVGSVEVCWIVSWKSTLLVPTLTAWPGPLGQKEVARISNVAPDPSAQATIGEPSTPIWIWG